MKLLFPEYEWHKYAKNHFSFLHQYAELAGIEVSLVNNHPRVFTYPDKWVISCLLNGQQIMFDYADHDTALWLTDEKIPYFKFHYNKHLHGKYTNVFPVGPSLVADKRMHTPIYHYFAFRDSFVYSPGRKIVNKQVAYAGATERRNRVRSMLLQNFKEADLQLEKTHQAYWQSCRDACAVVCVPGATNNMLDRGQYELMGLGVCTVSPRLPDILPYGAELIPGFHYIQCADDYSDLVAALKGLQTDPEMAKAVGNNARILFERVSMPVKYWEWVIDMVNTYV